MTTELANLTTRVEADTMRRLRIESAICGESLRELVQIALDDLLMRREDGRRDAAAFHRPGE